LTLCRFNPGRCPLLSKAAPLVYNIYMDPVNLFRYFHLHRFRKRNLYWWWLWRLVSGRPDIMQ